MPPPLAPAYSAATPLVITRTAPLDAPYSAWPATPTRPAAEDHVDDRSPRFTMCRTECFVPRKVPVTLIAMSRSHCSMLVSSSGEIT